MGLLYSCLSEAPENNTCHIVKKPDKSCKKQKGCKRHVSVRAACLSTLCTDGKARRKNKTENGERKNSSVVVKETATAGAEEVVMEGIGKGKWIRVVKGEENKVAGG